jgi:hypothetical protein
MYIINYMKRYIQYSFLLFIIITLLNCSFDKNKRAKIYIDVVIENKTQNKLYTGKLDVHSLYCGDNEKVYNLVTSIDYDASNMTFDCFGGNYVYDIEIPANDIIKIKMENKIDKIFEINNERYSIELDKQYGYKTIFEDNSYNDNEIKFLIYYTNKKINVKNYSDYVETIKEKGYQLYGHYKNGVVHFLIE